MTRQQLLDLQALLILAKANLFHRGTYGEALAAVEMELQGGLPVRSRP